MRKKMISLGADGRLLLKSGDGRESSIANASSVAVVYLSIDCSGSMAGKLEQARRGAIDFAEDALRKGYQVGLMKFNDDATLICQAQKEKSALSDGLSRLSATGGTNMVAAFKLGEQHLTRTDGIKALVVVTDGYPNDVEATIAAAQIAGSSGIRIICIGTDDADESFLRKLSTSDDLAAHVTADNLAQGIRSASNSLLLPRKA